MTQYGEIIAWSALGIFLLFVSIALREKAKRDVQKRGIGNASHQG